MSSPFQLILSWSLRLLLLTCLSQAGVGAVVENLPASFYERPGLDGMPRIDYESMKVVNVRDFGAKGDGIQDERGAFAKAVEAVGSGGGIVFIPKGNYFFGRHVLPDRSSWSPKSVAGDPLNNVHFVGEGDASAILYEFKAPELEKQGYYLWNLGAARNCSVRDLRFSTSPLLDQRWNPGIGAWCLAFGGAENTQVLRIVIDQGRMGTVFWKGATGNRNTWVVGCSIRNTGADSIHFNDSVNTTVAYNEIENSGDDGIAMVAQGVPAGENFLPTKGNRYLHNTVLGVRWGRCILLSGADMEVAGNWLEASVWPGVYLQSRGHNLVEGNVYPPVENALVAGNTAIRNNLASRKDNFSSHGRGLPGSIHGGLLVTSATIRDNRILAGQNDGIQFGRPEFLKSEELVIKNNAVFANLGAGLRVLPGDDSYVNRLVVEGNQFAGNADGAVQIGSGVREIVPPDAGTAQQAASSPVEDSFAEVRRADSEKDWDLPVVPKIEGLTERNVKDFGAVGDGVADERAALEKAIAALPREGGIVRIPRGKYRIVPAPGGDSVPDSMIRHHLLIGKLANVHIVGEGEESELILTSDRHQGIRFLNVRGCSIRDLKIRLDTPPAYRKNRALVDVAASEDVGLENLSIVDSGGPGILLNASRKVVVRKCTVLRAGTEGVNVAASRQVLVEENTITGGRDHGVKVGWAGAGIARSPQFVRIRGNTIREIQQGAGVGVASGDQVEILDNEIRDACLAGVGLYDQAKLFSSQRVAVSGNRFENCPSNPGLSYAGGAVGLWNLRSANPEPRYEFRIVDNRFGKGTPISYSSATSTGFKSLVVSGNRDTEGKPVEFAIPQPTPKPAPKDK